MSAKESLSEQKETASSEVKPKTEPESSIYARLPCRGCLASCKNYHRCDGKVWRMSL